MPRDPKMDHEGRNKADIVRERGPEPAGLDVDDGRIERREAEGQRRAQANKNPPKKEDAQTVRTGRVSLRPWTASTANVGAAGKKKAKRRSPPKPRVTDSDVVFVPEGKGVLVLTRTDYRVLTQLLDNGTKAQKLLAVEFRKNPARRHKNLSAPKRHQATIRLIVSADEALEIWNLVKGADSVTEYRRERLRLKTRAAHKRASKLRGVRFDKSGMPSGKRPRVQHQTGRPRV